MTTFKLFFKNNDIRRITKPVASYEEFIFFLNEIYPQYHLELLIKYVDKEGDKIAVTSQLEWEEMKEELKDEKIIKLYIEEGTNPKGYFKDGPAPEPVELYSENNGEKSPEEDWFNFKIGVPRCLESLFRDHKIIPSSIPSFLKDAIKVDYKNSELVDLDIDIPLLFDLLHKQAIENLGSLQKDVIEKGRDYLVTLTELKPDNYVALYNLACAESLLNNVPKALTYLENAIRNGYRNIEHLINDSDFDNIRNSEGFIDLINLISELGEGSFVDQDDVECYDGNECHENDCENCLHKEGNENEGNENEVELNNEPVILEYNGSIYEDNINEEDKEENLNDNLSESFLDLRNKWATQIATLKSLGFTVDDEVLSLILEQANGDIESVTNILIQSSNSL